MVNSITLKKMGLAFLFPIWYYFGAPTSDMVLNTLISDMVLFSCPLNRCGTAFCPLPLFIWEMYMCTKIYVVILMAVMLTVAASVDPPL